MFALKMALTPTPSTSPQTANIHASPFVVASPMVTPAFFSGLAEDCKGVILQCSAYLQNNYHCFPTEEAKILFIISLLIVKALLWVDSIWAQAGPSVQSASQFLQYSREVFGRCTGDSSVNAQLFSLHQGNMSIYDYAIRFRSLATASGWKAPALLTTYQH